MLSLSKIHLDDSASLEGGELTDAQKALRFELEAKALQFELGKI